MRLGVDFNILNQKGTPAFYSDIFANRPTYGFAGRVFISTDTGAIYEDTGSAWTLIADAGAGTTGTLQQVTTNGNTTTLAVIANSFQGNALDGNYFLRNEDVEFRNDAIVNSFRLVGRTNTDRALIYFGATGTNYFGYDGTNLVLNSSVQIPTLTTGSILFAGASGLLSESNATFFWDNTNKRLGIGNASPGAPLDIHSTGTNAQFNGTGTNNAYLQFQNAGTNKWRIGNTYSAGANTFDLYNNVAASTALSFNSTTNNATFNGGIRTTGTADQQLWVYGSTPSLRLYDTTTSPTIVGFVGMATGVNNFILGSASGDMCIGTSTAGKIFIGSGTTTVNPALTILSSGASTFSNSLTALNINAVSTNPYLLLNDTSGVTSGSIAFFNNGTQKWNLATQGTTQDLGLYNNGGTSSFNLYVKYSTGQVFIGQTTASAATAGTKCQILGDTLMTGSLAGVFFENRSGGVTASTNWGGWYYVGTSTNLYNGSANIAAINMSTGVYTPLSNINKKKDFEESNIGLNEILKLKPTLYRMLDQDDNINKSLGFIAQEVKKYLPQAYVENINDNDTFIGLSEMPFIAAIVKSIQQLNDKLVRNNIN